MRTVYRLCFLDYHPDMLEYVESPVGLWPFKDYSELHIKLNKDSVAETFSFSDVIRSFTPVGDLDVS